MDRPLPKAGVWWRETVDWGRTKRGVFPEVGLLILLALLIFMWPRSTVI